MNIETVDIAILGAGIAGLGAALRAGEQNRNAIIFESKNSAGGLLNNFEINGYYFDQAVHLSFTSNNMVRSIFDQTPYFTHAPDSFCFDRGYWLKHPVQNNLYPLPVEEKIALIESFANRQKILKLDNYKDWLTCQYGEEISKRYPVRYTRKYWDTDASALSTTWIGNRMHQTSFKEVLHGAFTSDTPNAYYANEMRYPKSGGYRSFIQPLIDLASIQLKHQAVLIDPDKKTILFQNGKIINYNYLVSTMPLPVLISILKSAPDKVVEASRKLIATSVDLISVGFSKNLIDKLWFYIYNEDILSSRAYSPSIKSPHNVPNATTSSLQFEVYSRGHNCQYNRKILEDNTCYALKKMNICNSDDIVFMDHRRIDYGNVIFDIGMENYRSIVRKYLDSIGVITCGRFGEWDYLWSDQALLSGYRSIETVFNKA